jgi:hypothetical protein
MVDPETARARIEAHFAASNVGAAGGAPEDDIARTYPARQQFELHRTTGCHDLWVNEYTIRYEDKAVMVVGIMEFRGEQVVRERIYFGDPWEPPAWRAQWVERFDLTEQ